MRNTLSVEPLNEGRAIRSGNYAARLRPVLLNARALLPRALSLCTGAAHGRASESCSGVVGQTWHRAFLGASTEFGLLLLPRGVSGCKQNIRPFSLRGVQPARGAKNWRRGRLVAGERRNPTLFCEQGVSRMTASRRPRSAPAVRAAAFAPPAAAAHH
jgi:hypothetical protein